MNAFSSSPRRRIAGFVVFLALAVASLPAQNWNGAGADDNFSSAANWAGNSAPANNGTATATFTGTTRTTPALDTDYALSSVVIAATGFTLDGSHTLTLSESLLKSGTGYLDFTANVPIALAGDISVGGANTNGSIYLNGTVSGDHSLSFSGNAYTNLYLGGENTFTGPLKITSGAVYVGTSNAVSAGSINSDVELSGDGRFIINRTGNIQFDHVISGSSTGFAAFSVTGALSPRDATTVTLGAQSTYTGDTSVAGTLVIGVADALPTTTTLSLNSFGTIKLSANQTVGNLSGGTGGMIDVASDLTFTANLSANSTIGGTTGAGHIAINGAYNLQTYDAWTHTGGTTLTDTNLIIGAGYQYGSLTGDVTNNGRVTFNQSTTQTYAGNMTGSGALTKQNSNQLNLTGDLALGGGVIIDGGTLNVGNGTTSGSLDADVTINSGTLQFWRTDAVNFTKNISGAGTLALLTSDTFTLTGNATQALTQVYSGTFEIGDGGTTGSVTGDISTSRTVRFNRSDNITYSGTISGNGSIQKVGANTLTLDHANTFKGTLTVDGGRVIGAVADAFSTSARGFLNNTSTLEIAAPQTLASLDGSATSTVQINAGQSLTLSGGGVHTLSSTLTGSGSLAQTGNSSLTLNGDGSAYTGAMTFSSGATYVTGDFGHASILLASGSSMSVGIRNAPNTLTIQDFTLAGGAKWIVDAPDATAGAGTGWDLINANGTIAFTATSANPLTLKLQSVTSLGTLTNMANFSPDADYSWNLVTGAGGITGFDPDATILDTVLFPVAALDTFTGTLSLSQIGNSVFLNYRASAVPEPATYAALLGCLAFGFVNSRRRPRAA